MAVSTTKVKVPRMKLGSQGLEVSALGLGCLGLSSKPEPDMINLIHHAINSGITFFDTADIYGPHINEILIGKALKGGMREKVQLASKFGIGTVNGEKGIYGDPKYVRAACESSLKRLDVDYIDLYYQHRVDTRVAIELTMGELKKLVEEGKIKYIGLCGASPSTIRRAHAVHPITAVQLEWSLQTRDSEEDIIPICRELGIGIVVYSPLGHGFLTSKPKREENPVGREVRPSRPKRDESSSQNDSEKNRPRTRSRPENLEDKSKLYDRVIEMAAKKGCTPSQLALAWLHHQGSDVCPIPGTTKIENLEQNIGALSVNLTAEDMSELELITSGEGVKGDSSAGRSSKNADTPPLESWKVE